MRSELTDGAPLRDCRQFTVWQKVKALTKLEPFRNSKIEWNTDIEFVTSTAEFFIIINDWLAKYLTLIASVGIPLLTLYVTSRIASAATAASNEAAKKQRELTYKLKMADFRQAWINDMREDLALYTALTWSSDLNKGAESEKARVIANARILMRMNTKDQNYEVVQKSLLDPVASKEKGSRALYQVGQDILKAEWTRVKDDLEAVDGEQVLKS